MKNHLVTLNLILKRPQLNDLKILKNFEDRNRSHLAKWESVVDFSCEQACQRRLSNWENEYKEGQSVRFFIFKKANLHQLIGMCNFTQIFRGAFQACYLGYKIDRDYEGKGLMMEALQSAISYIFEKLGLHRIMASYLPINIRSAKLLSRLGFEIEGFAKNYLLINDKWEDHVLTALSYEKWQSIQKNAPHSHLSLSPEKKLEMYLYTHIPISKAIGIKVEQASLHKVILTAPFSNNINHKKTVFGGSLHAVTTLACWSLLHINLKHKYQSTQIVITKSHITYHAPVNVDFKVECIIPDDEAWHRFIKMLHSKGKGRIHLSATIYHQDQLCVSYNATFAAITLSESIIS